MRKILTFFVAIFTFVAVFAAARPSLDGRAVVADAGDMPKGLFARTIGYLPGDSVCVTNPATGSTVDVLILGAIDANEGVAILLSPEAADVLNITKNSNVQVKITKRTGSLDETVKGSAMIEEDGDDGIIKTSIPYEETPSPVTPAEQIAPVSENIAAETVEEASQEILPVEIDNQNEINESEPAEENFENVPSAIEDDSFTGLPIEEVPAEKVEVIEQAPVETVTEELPPLPQEPETPSYSLEPDVEELPLQPVEVVEQQPVEQPPVEVVEVVEVTAPPAEETEPEEYVEPVKVVENVPSEKISEELPPAEDPVEQTLVEEVPSELPENAPVEAVTETAPELEEDKPAEEPVTEEPAPVEEIADEKVEEELPPIEEDIAPNLSVAPEDTIEVSVPEEEPTVDFDSEITDVTEEETVEVPGVVKEEPETENDEYQPIVLVPVDNNPPETVEETPVEEEIEVSPVEADIPSPSANVKAEEVSTVEEEVSVTPEASKDYTSFLTTEDKLVKNSWYIQIGTFGSKENVNAVVKKYGEKYPLAIIELNGGKMYRIMVGPLNVDEYRSVHEKFKSYGYKDSFLKKIK